MLLCVKTVEGPSIFASDTTAAVPAMGGFH